MIMIYGASDDLVEVSGCAGADEFCMPAARHGDICWSGRLIAPVRDGEREQLLVRAIYDGCWHFALGQVDESLPFPTWPLTIRQGTSEEAEYSVVLEIDAPAGTELIDVWPGADGR